MAFPELRSRHSLDMAMLGAAVHQLLLLLLLLLLSVSSSLTQARRHHLADKSSSSTACNATVKRKLFVEYLGAEGFPVRYTQAPINPDVDFYFILSFAVDADEQGRPQNGTFRPVWVDELTPESTKSIKASNPNVKVLLSLAGWSIYTSSGKDKVLFWYDSPDPEAWIQNAYDSIAKLVEDYSLDGIDIDYESFHSPNTTFAHCIGELITRLKADGVIEVATIAPFNYIEAHYRELYAAYNASIDYVNYQFYTSDHAPGVKEFVATYVRKAATFGTNKTLASMQVVERGIQGEAFFEGIHSILNVTQGEMPGIMIYSLDSSIEHSTNFTYEIRSQEILAAAAAAVTSS